MFPKPFDLFNLSLYGSMIPLSLRAHDWLLMYVGLLTNGGNAAFMWVSGPLVRAAAAATSLLTLPHHLKEFSRDLSARLCSMQRVQ